MTPASSRSGYFSIASRAGAIPELDGLRAIAILLVLLRHAVRPIYEEHGRLLQVGDWDLAVPFLNGWMGVDLFFVLSGFLITHHLLNRWPERFNSTFLLRYWGKRVLRTFPAFYATLAIVALGIVPFYQPDVSDVRASLVQHLFFLQDYFGSEFVPAFWSLGVEEKFYLTCPFVLLLLARHSRPQQVRILIALAAVPVLLRVTTVFFNRDVLGHYGDFFWMVRSPFHLAVDGLWMGVLSALLYRWRAAAIFERPRCARSLLVLGSVLLAVLISSFAWFDAAHYWASAVVLTLVPLGFACLMVAVISSKSALNQWLCGRGLRFLAVTSYSIYLVHMTVIPLALRAAALVPAYQDAPPLTQFLVFLPGYLLLSVAGGVALHLLVEKPFLILKDRIRL